MRSVRGAAERRAPAPAPTGSRGTRVFPVADADGDVPYRSAETMDVEPWAHVAPAIDALTTRTRGEGGTVAIAVAQADVPRGA